MITNHTFSDLVLRPPGIAPGRSFDETVYKALGDAMAAQNGYTARRASSSTTPPGRPRTGRTSPPAGSGSRSRSAATQSRLPSRLRGQLPPLREVVAEYEGTSPRAQAVGGKGNREAYMIAQESTDNPERHSVLAGDAPPGAVLKLEKRFQTATSPQADGSRSCSTTI